VPFTVHIDANRTWGGGQEQSLGLARALAARGHRTCFVSQQGSALAERSAVTDLEHRALPIRGLRGLLGQRQLRRLFRSLRPDLVHVHDSAAQLPAIWALGALRGAGSARRKPRLVVTRRTVFPIRHRYRPLSYHLLCDRVICISEAVRQCLVHAQVSSGKLVVIPDFVDCAHFDPAAVVAERHDERPTILSIGRLTREKGHRVLLEAMARVVQAVPSARLRVCGIGEEEARLKKFAEAGGISSQVAFVGFVPDPRTELASADVFAMPSLSEGLGVAVLEAMAMGVPVVATDAGGLPEAVAHGESGLVVPAGHAEALAEALVSLLRDPARRREMGRRGRERVLAYYDKPKVVDRIVALYQEVLAGG
jgi:glycosyltransferase involved in cell wall biosynthesis